MPSNYQLSLTRLSGAPSFIQGSVESVPHLSPSGSVAQWDGVSYRDVEFAGLDCGRYELAHAKNARFIKFIYLAMRPFFALTEASLASVSKRWKRLKDLHNQAP